MEKKTVYELIEFDKKEPGLPERYGVIYEGEDYVDSSYYDGHVFIDSVRPVKYWLKPSKLYILTEEQMKAVEEMKEALDKIQNMKLEPGEHGYEYVFNRCWHYATNATINYNKQFK